MSPMTIQQTHGDFGRGRDPLQVIEPAHLFECSSMSDWTFPRKRPQSASLDEAGKIVFEDKARSESGARHHLGIVGGLSPESANCSIVLLLNGNSHQY